MLTRLSPTLWGHSNVGDFYVKRTRYILKQTHLLMITASLEAAFLHEIIFFQHIFHFGAAQFFCDLYENFHGQIEIGFFSVV